MKYDAELVDKLLKEMEERANRISALCKNIVGGGTTESDAIDP